MESAKPVLSQKKLSAIILAAGLSRRMGPENKLLLKYKDSSLIQETIKQLSLTNGIHEMIVVLGHEAEKLKAVLTSTHLKIVVNQDYALGQTSSIQKGVSESDLQSQGYMICLGDMPFLLAEDYNQLISFWNQTPEKSIVRPVVQSKPGHPVIFDAKYQSDILNEQHTEGCRTVIKKHKSHLIQFESDNGRYLIDIDMPEDKFKLG